MKKNKDLTIEEAFALIGAPVPDGLTIYRSKNAWSYSLDGKHMVFWNRKWEQGHGRPPGLPVNHLLAIDVYHYLPPELQALYKIVGVDEVPELQDIAAKLDHTFSLAASLDKRMDALNKKIDREDKSFMVLSKVVQEVELTLNKLTHGTPIEKTPEGFDDSSYQNGMLQAFMMIEAMVKESQP